MYNVVNYSISINSFNILFLFKTLWGYSYCCKQWNDNIDLIENLFIYLTAYIFHSASVVLSEWVDSSLSEWVDSSVSEWVDPSLSEWVDPSLLEWVDPSLSDWVDPSLLEWVDPSLSDWVDSSLSEWVDSSLSEWVSEWVGSSFNNTLISIEIS